jgi:hypothetical protein
MHRKETTFLTFSSSYIYEFNKRKISIIFSVKMDLKTSTLSRREEIHLVQVHPQSIASCNGVHTCLKIT